MAAFDDTSHPIRSFMNSMERLRTFWRLWTKSSDWCAKENECKDSEGNRDKSSVKLGEAGPGDIDFRWPGGGLITESDVDRERPTDGLREEAAEDGRVGVRCGGC